MTPDSLFKLLADSTRLRCLLLLVEEGEVCVCELTHALEMIQPKISRHLALLREANLVQDRRRGQWIYYRLHPDLPDWVRRILQETAQAANQARYTRDRQRLTGMTNRPGAACCT